MTNMEIYEAGRSVPPEAQKSFSNGSFSGTDINPMWRIKKLTELFGPSGIGWYTEVLSERAETYGETVMAIVDINLYVKVDGEWSKPIFGTGGNLLVQATKSGARPSDEGYKKAYTDALSIACKALGIGADIWYSKDPTASDPTSKYAASYVPINAQPVNVGGFAPDPRQSRGLPSPQGGEPANESAPPEGWAQTDAPLPWDEPAKASVSVTPSLICAECGQPIEGYTTKAGKRYEAEDIARMNQRAYGQSLCSKCGFKRKGKS